MILGAPLPRDAVEPISQSVGESARQRFLPGVENVYGEARRVPHRRMDRRGVVNRDRDQRRLERHRRERVRRHAEWRAGGIERGDDGDASGEMAAEAAEVIRPDRRRRHRADHNTIRARYTGLTTFHGDTNWPVTPISVSAMPRRSRRAIARSNNAGASMP